MEHNTPLRYHFKHIHIWFDMSILAVLFIIAAYIPLLKIVPLIASLELFSFFCFHLLAKHSRFQVQGFLGGFISSTAVFLQILNDKKFSSISERNLLLTLLFTLSAMLLECIFIIYFLSKELSFVYYLPFITQLLFFAMIILYLKSSSCSQFQSNPSTNYTVDIELLNDHPIIWRNVAKLSILIFMLITAMHFIGSSFGFSRDLTTLFVSLFEAHAILASVMTELSSKSQDIELLKLFFIILLGNSISKSYLTFKGSNLQQKKFFVIIIFTSLLASLIVTLTFYQKFL